MKKLCLYILFILSMSLAVSSEVLKDQMITYANFNFINYVASSIDHVYFATTEGITRYNKMEDRWEAPLTGGQDIDNQNIKKVWVDTFDEKIYIETGISYFEYDLLFDRWFPVFELPNIQNDARHVSPPDIMYAPFTYNYSNEGILIDVNGRYFSFTDILDDNSGTLWIGTWGYGAARAGESTDIIELMPFGLLQNRVNAIYKEGPMLWVSGAYFDSYRSGITIFNTENNEFSYIESGLNNDFPAVGVNCLTGDRNYLYIGTPYGLILYDRESQFITKTFTTRSGLIDNNVLSLLVTDNTIFAGTENGMSILTLKNDSTRYTQLAQFTGSIIYDFEIADSAVWIATDDGAFRYVPASGKIQRFQDPSMILFMRVYDIERYENDLWFSSDGGIVKLDLETGDIKPFQASVETATPRALAINEEIAAVGSDKGLLLIYYRERSSRRREFTTDDGLPSNYVYCLTIDGDYLWVGTDLGLTRFWWNNPDRID